MRTVWKSATFLATESVNSAPIKRGEIEVQIFWQGKAQNSSPILRCTFLARRSAKLIANFSATMVTSLPSFSLCISLSLSLSPNVPHAQYRKRFRVSYNTERERDGSDVTIFARLAMNSHFHLPKIRTIGDELTLSLAKNSHFSFLPSYFPSLPSRRGHHCGAKIRNEFTLSFAKNFSPSLFPLFQMARAARRAIENPRQMIKSCPVLFCSSHRKTESN